MKNKDLLLEILSEISEILKEYERLDRALFDFDLRKDVLVLHETQKELIEKIEKEINPNNIKDNIYLQDCNKELSDLGIEQRFEIKHKKGKTFNELIYIIQDSIEATEEKYENYPIVAWAILNRLSDNFELLKQAHNSKNQSLYEEISNKIISFDHLNLSELIVDIVGECLSFYGSTYEELTMLKKELTELGFEDKIHEIEKKIVKEEYRDYVNMKSQLLEKSSIKQLVLPYIKKGSNH